MGRFTITQFNLQLMDAVSDRFQFLHASSEFIPVSQLLVQLRDLFAQDADFLLLNFAGLLGGPAGFQGVLDFVRLSGRKRIELTDPMVSFRKGLLQLLERVPMGRFAITEFDLQLMHAILGRFQLFHADSDVIPVGQPLVQLRDLFAQDTDFLLQDFAGLLSRLMGLLGTPEFIRLSGGKGIELPDAVVTFREGLLQLLERIPMGRLPITQFDFQLMDAVLNRFQLFHAGSDFIPVGEAFLELRDLFAQDADFLLLNLTGLLSGPTGLQGIPNFVRLSRRK
jgi:hypothetical protein